MPSEAQWEFAARGQKNLRYPWGDEAPDATRACFGQQKPTPVGRYPAGRGPFGTLDQAGNVWEWCKDRWEPGAYKTEVHQGPRLDPVIETGNVWVHGARGGSFLEIQPESTAWLAASFRSWGWGNDGYDRCGFRVVVVGAAAHAAAHR